MSRLPPERSVRIRTAAVAAIASHARAERPRECCGLLIGVDDVVIDAVATANVAADPVRQYEIPPAEYVAQIRRCRTLSAETGRRHDVIGAYHSHPGSAPMPSPTDLEEAFGEFVFVIAGPVTDAGEIEMRAYRLEGGRFESIELIAD